MTQVVTIRDLLEAGVHFGHRSRYWNPKMKPYIYGTRAKIHIINLEHTLPALRKAQTFVREIARNRNKLLFVGTKRAARPHIEEAVKKINQPYVCNRWLGGMLTNYKTIRVSIRRYNDLKMQFEDGTINKLTKKEILVREREMNKLESSIGGIKDMGGLPDAVFVIDVDRECIAMNEITNLGIPVIALVDTNCNPDGIDYIIPGNDDSTKSIKLFVNAITDAYIEGEKEADKLNPIETGPTITARKKTSLGLRKGISRNKPAEANTTSDESKATKTSTKKKDEIGIEASKKTETNNYAVAEINATVDSSPPKTDNVVTSAQAEPNQKELTLNVKVEKKEKVNPTEKNDDKPTEDETQ